MADDADCNDAEVKKEAARCSDLLAKATQKASELLESLRQDGSAPAITGGVAGGFWDTSDREMRIIMCADTNTAANRLLEGLVSFLGLDNRAGGSDQQGHDREGLAGAPYRIVRVGPLTEVRRPGCTCLVSYYAVPMRHASWAGTHCACMVDLLLPVSTAHHTSMMTAVP